MEISVIVVTPENVQEVARENDLDPVILDAKRKAAWDRNEVFMLTTYKFRPEESQR